MPRGYDHALYIQPFDHRGSFRTKLFGWKPPLSDAQTAEIASAKQVIYDGFQSALAAGVHKDKAGILVDEQFTAAILHDAAAKGIVTACPAEQSGQDEFDFWGPLVAWRAKNATREQAVTAIAARYREFVDLFARADVRFSLGRPDRVRPEHRSSKEG